MEGSGLADGFDTSPCVGTSVGSFVPVVPVEAVEDEAAEGSSVEVGLGEAVEGEASE